MIIVCVGVPDTGDHQAPGTESRAPGFHTTAPAFTDARDAGLGASVRCDDLSDDEDQHQQTKEHCQDDAG